MPKFVEYMRALGTPIRGVVHVGANRGEELGDYLAVGANPVVWIEAEPATFEVLAARISGSEGHTAINALVSGVDGDEIDFNVANHGSQSSSIFEFGLHSDFYPSVQFESKLRMTTSTIDTLIADRGLDYGAFNAMCLDIQGAELQALFGARKLLKHMDCVEVEISDAELYRGGATAAQIVMFMELNGFLTINYLIGPTNYGDAVFMRSAAVASKGGLSL